jgi:hypothetical protein
MDKGPTKGLVTWKKYGDWLEPVSPHITPPHSSHIPPAVRLTPSSAVSYQGRVPSLSIIGEMGSGFNYGQVGHSVPTQYSPGPSMGSVRRYWCTDATDCP